MIPAVVASNSFGPWLRTARLGSADPTTGAPYTQERLGELMHISSSKVAAWERGDIKSIAPDDAHLLSRILNRSEKEILEAIGYDVGSEGLTEDEKALLAAYRRLRVSPILQETALKVIQVMPATNAPQRGSSRRRQGA
jgi:transcriptional regulator with XRE-family HTH domain